MNLRPGGILWFGCYWSRNRNQPKVVCSHSRSLESSSTLCLASAGFHWHQPSWRDRRHFFLNPALDVIFAARKKSSLFVKCRSDDILQNIETASLLLLITPGASDISQA